MKFNDLYIGTSGWSYKSWVGPFYPKGTSAREYLAHYVKKFRVVEIDSTFYATPRLSTVKNWRSIAPEGFLYCPKFPRTITHDKMLQDVAAETSEFLTTMDMLEDHLGPLILQFEYKFGPQFFARLASFLESLPDELRFAVEVRNRKWYTDSFFDLLAEHNVALVLSDLYYMPRIAKLTTDFTIVRLLGDRRKIPDNDFSELRLDRSDQLDYWAKHITGFLDQGVGVFTFSNNRFEGHAPETIARLEKRLAAHR